MNYQIEYVALANALYCALTEDDFYQVLEDSVEGDKATKKQAMLAYMDYSIIESQTYADCFIPTQQHYGVSIWSKPLDQKTQAAKDAAKKSFIENNMGLTCFSCYQQICSAMSINAAPFELQQDWYLSIVGISPEFQGQGLGPGLVQSVLEKTDELNVATYLETFTPRNIPFYTRLGYQSLGDFSTPLTKNKYRLMRRLAG